MKRKDFSHLKIASISEKEPYFDHEDYIAGVSPFLRGIKSTMFVQNKWRTTKIIVVPIPISSDFLIKEPFEKGYHSFQISFNENTHNHAITKSQWLATFEILLPELKSTNCTVIFDLSSLSDETITAFFEASKEAQEFIELKIALLIDISNSISFEKFLKNDSVNFSFILHFKNTNTIEELTELLFASNKIITTALLHNMTIDAISKKIAFSLNITKNQFESIAKLRAARWLWAKLMKHLNAKNQHTYALHIHTICHTDLDVSTSIFGGAQFISSNKQPQLYFELETNITNTVDPWAGSVSMERNTHEIAQKVWSNFTSKKN